MDKLKKIEKLKKLRDSNALTEEEFNIEKQKILKHDEKNRTIKLSTLFWVFLITFIVVTVICIIVNLNNSKKEDAREKDIKEDVQENDIPDDEMYNITTVDGNELSINKTKLNNAITQIERKLSVSETIGIVYKGNDVISYILPVYDSSKREATSIYDYYMVGTETLRTYTAYTLSDNSNLVEEGVKIKGKLSTISNDTDIGAIEISGLLSLPEDFEILIISYEKNGLINIFNDKTNRVKNSRSEFYELSLIERAKLLYNTDGITESELKERYNNTYYVIYDSWEECFDDFEKNNMIVPLTEDPEEY